MLKIPKKLTLEGKAKKSVFEMTPEEFKEAGKQVVEIAKRNAYSKGLPLIGGEDDKTYAYYPDGKKILILYPGQDLPSFKPKN